MKSSQDTSWQAFQTVMSLLGMRDTELFACMVAAVIAVLLLLVVLLVVLLLRARARRKRQTAQIEELNDQVLGLQAMVHLTGATISEDGDSIVYQSTGVEQQIPYEEFPDDVVPVVKRAQDDESIAEEIEDKLESIRTALHGRHAHREEGHGQVGCPEQGTARSVFEEHPVPGIVTEGSPASSHEHRGVGVPAPAAATGSAGSRSGAVHDGPRPGAGVLEPLSAEQVKNAHAAQQPVVEVSAAPEAGTGASAVPPISAREARIDSEVDAILNAIKRDRITGESREGR